ncbi:MAG: phosphotransferase [Candidatus Riflemargulisbacteria bacterium]
MLNTAKQLLSDYWEFNPSTTTLSKQLRSFFRDSEIIHIENNLLNYILKVTPINLEHLVIKNQLISKIAINSGAPVITSIKEYIIKDNFIYELYPMMNPLEIETINLTETNITDLFIGLQNIKADVPELLITDINVSNILHNEYLKDNLYKYLPYIETSFIHGDLHPHNILTNNNQLYLSDWETAATGPKLYDFAFFCGCLGLHGENYLKSDTVKLLLQSLSNELYLDPLSIDTFHALLVYTRIRWLLVWQNNKDIEMIENENNYINYLIDNHTSLNPFWKEHLISNLSHATKWIITDANFTDDILELKNNNNLHDLPIEILSPKIPQLIIAFGKENNITKTIDLLELHKTFSNTTENINDLLISFINFSLDSARLKHKKSLQHIIYQVESNYTNHELTPTCLAYLYRNYFTLLTEDNDNLSLEPIKSKFKLLLSNNPDNLAIWEEYSRILSGEINYYLIKKNFDEALIVFNELTQLKTNYPESVKIAATFKTAEKNMSK